MSPRGPGGWNLPESKWANPFTVAQCGGSVKVAIERYREYLLKRPDLLAQIMELDGKVLGCWCKKKPLDPCHGDVLVEQVLLAKRAKLAKSQS